MLNVCEWLGTRNAHPSLQMGCRHVVVFLRIVAIIQCVMVNLDLASWESIVIQLIKEERL